jgi:hypothetical protein
VSARRASGAEQVVDGLGDADEPAAVVTQVDDVVLQVLRAELGKGVAQLRIRRRNIGAQVQVAHPVVPASGRISTPKSSGTGSIVTVRLVRLASSVVPPRWMRSPRSTPASAGPIRSLKVLPDAIDCADRYKTAAFIHGDDFIAALQSGIGRRAAPEHVEE